MPDNIAYYGTLEFCKPDKHDSFRGNHWLIKGHQPALMASRVVPNSWSNGVGERCIPDNIAAAEHLNWIMMRYPLRILSPQLWNQRVEILTGITKKRESLRTLTEEIKVDARFNGTLLPFQKKGLDFLLKTDGCALLADEMGLGKTIEALAYLVTATETFPCLIIAPLVTLVNWEREIEKFVTMKPGKPFVVKKIRSGKKEALSGQRTLEESEPLIYL
ncbi:MAG: SNF2-related protein, partial [Candidatus Paceibacterota bacterium]